MLLEVSGLHVHYGKVEAVRNVSLTLGEGEIITLIGANGAGKTSILKTISGVIRPSSGEIRYRGERIDGTSADTIVKGGIAHVPEGRRLFRLMTVGDNLRVGAYTETDNRVIAERMEAVFQHFPILRDRQSQPARNLSGGQQQMVAIGRAMMSAPKIVIMDEPSLGLAPIVIGQIAKIIRDLKAEEHSIILVEQNASLALKLADRAYVLETGSITLQGNSKDLLDDPHIVKAYLGA